MEYSEVKLGLIGRFRVWNRKRIIEAQRKKYYKDTGELLEIDYSEADKLEADILEQKRIKKATKDASQLYKQVYGKSNAGISEADFIEEYLVVNELKQKVLPEPEISERHSFMKQYPTEKSPQELAHEKANRQHKIYYRINDKDYELPLAFYQYATKRANTDKPLPLEEQDNGDYILVDDKMNPHDKYDMLSKMFDIVSTNAMIWINEYLLDIKNEQLEEQKNGLSKKIHFREYVAKKQFAEGEIDRANDILTKGLEDVLKFEQKILQNEQEKARE